MDVWVRVVLTIILTIVGYSVILLLAARLLIPKLSGYYLFYLPLLKFTASHRQYYIARQLGVELEDIQLVGKGLFYNKKDERTYRVGQFMGIQLLDEAGKVLDSNVLNNNAYYISDEISKWERGDLVDGNEQ